MASELEILNSEKLFYNNIHYDKNIFISFDTNIFNQWLIKQILYAWDKQIGLLDLKILKNKTVLEIGCGDMRMLKYFSSIGVKNIIGCDIAPNFVAAGSTRSYTYVYGRKIINPRHKLKILYGNYLDCLPPKLSCDIITCFQALHHMQLDQFIKKCRELLPINGYVIISDPNGRHPLRGIGNYIGRLSKAMSKYEEAYPPQHVINEFQKNGFKVIKFRSLNPLSEIYFQFTDLFNKISYSLCFYLKLPIVIMRYLDCFLEATILKIVPRLGWRYYLVLRKIN
jgi:SAM-dependent methyltransferase